VITKVLAYIGVAAFLTAYIGFNLHLHEIIAFKSDEDATTFWMIGMATAKAALSYSFYRHVGLKDKHLQVPVFIFFLFSLNELLDELFFNPYPFQANEFILLVSIGWYLTRIYGRKL
jgi:hypothetical protein